MHALVCVRGFFFVWHGGPEAASSSELWIIELVCIAETEKVYCIVGCGIFYISFAIDAILGYFLLLRRFWLRGFLFF